jgi:hypothetical protein
MKQTKSALCASLFSWYAYPDGSRVGLAEASTLDLPVWRVPTELTLRSPRTGDVRTFRLLTTNPNQDVFVYADTQRSSNLYLHVLDT